MRRLLEFIRQYSYCFLFLLLELVSLFMLFGYNSYQKAVFLTSASDVSGGVYSALSSVTSFFSQGMVNRNLQQRNLELEDRLAKLEAIMGLEELDSIQKVRFYDLEQSEYETVPARVVKNSINKTDNFITLDKGSLDGITPDMGVTGSVGVVGVVYKTSAHYSLVLSLLSSKSNLSCKIHGSEYFGYLKWEGLDSRHAKLVDLPRHAQVMVGDTVQTSGYSDIFPSGIMVGVVDDVRDSNDGLSYDIRVSLSSDFGRLSTATIINRRNREEIQQLNEDAATEKI